METLFLYFGKVILASGIMFLYYRIFLKDKTFHHYNRFYLLGTVLLSLLLPLIRVDYFTVELKDSPYLLLNRFQPFSTVNNTTHGFDVLTIAALVFGSVSLAMLTRFLYGIFTVLKFKKQYPHEKVGDVRLYMTNLENAPFSFFKNLFWKRDILTSSPMGQQILKHEMIHIEQKHSYDQMIIQTIAAVFWFNPFFYLIKKEISLIHEYLADKKSLKDSDTKTFAQMLLVAQFSGNIIPGTSPLLSSNLKKRLKMLQNPKTKFSYARRVLALPLLFTVAFAFLVRAKNMDIEKVNAVTESIISNTKTDTARIDEKIKAQHEKIESLQKEIDQEQLNMEGVNNRLSQKYKELEEVENKSGQRSKAYQNKLVEIDELHDRIDSVYVKLDNNQFKKIGELYGDLDKMYSSKEFRQRIDDFTKHAAEAKGYANSEESKKAVENSRRDAQKAKAYTNSPEFNKIIADAQRAAEQGRKAEAQARAESAEAIAYVNSPQFKKIIAEANAAAIAGKKAAAEATATAQKSSAQMSIVDGNNVYKVKGNSIIFNGIDDEDFDEIIINGKTATHSELSQLDPRKIKSTIFKVNNEDGKKHKNIEVTTK